MNEDNEFFWFIQEALSTCLGVIAAMYVYRYFNPPETYNPVRVSLAAVSMNEPGQTLSNNFIASVDTEEQKELITKWAEQHIKELCDK